MPAASPGLRSRWSLQPRPPAAYEYDPAGHKTRQTDGDGDVTTWIYGAAYQLRAERRSGPNGFSTTFAYDPAGNRLTEAADGDVATFQYDAANQLVRAERLSGITTYGYDASGNQRSIEAPSGDVTTHGWDFENRMVSIEQPDGGRTTYVYAANNQKDEFLYATETDAGCTDPHAEVLLFTIESGRSGRGS